MRGWQLRGSRSLMVLALACLLLPAALAAGLTPMTSTAIVLPTQHPCLACTPDELARLRAALPLPGPVGGAVRWRVKAADEALKTEPVFPPRGGQHNQWYQCDPCQLALETVDDTHHRCPKCGTVYTGEPYDDVIFSRQHGKNLSRLLNAAWAYALTGEAQYAGDAKRILLGYAERYRQYPYHTNDRGTSEKNVTGGHLNEQTLGEASMMATQIAPACDLVWNALTPAERDAVCDGLLRPMLANIDRYKAGKSNWQSWHNAALFAGSMLTGDAAMAQRSIDDPRNGFLAQMAVSVSADGMWYENSWSYHAYTLQALTTHADAARRCGVDLWGQAAFRKMFLLPAQYVMADGSLPRFGDAVGAAPGVNPAQMEAAFAVYREPALLAQLPAAPSWESVLYGRDTAQAAPKLALDSVVVPAAGHVLLRTRGPAGLSAALTFGPYGGFHGHFDKLSFVFFGLGQELGVDPGRAKSQAYRLPIHTHWYKATIGHNAVVVDGAPQKPAEGKLLAFAANAEYAGAVASCDTAYAGVAHRRLLLLTPTYLLVLDALQADTPRRFDWIYHQRGTGVRCDAATAEAAPEANYPGQEYLRQLRKGTTDGPVRAVFPGRDVDTWLTCAAATGTGVRVGDGPGESVNERIPLIMLTRAGNAAHFAVALEPVRAGAAPAVSAVALEERPGALVARIRNGATDDLVTLTPDGRFTVTHGGAVVLER